MATYQSIQMSSPRYPVSGPGIGGRNIKVERGEVNLATTGALAAGSVIQMFKLHPRFRVTSGFIKVTGGAGASVTAILGDAGDDDRYFASASIAAAGTNVTIADTGRDYLTGGAYTIVNLTTAGATTNATGVIVAEIHGYIEEPA